MRRFPCINIGTGFASAGLFLLVGCIPIPATRQLQPDLSHRPEHYVGTWKSDPVRLGYTHIDDAFIVLSKSVKENLGTSHLFEMRPSGPEIHYQSGNIRGWKVSKDRRQFSMPYSIRTGTWVIPLLFTTWTETQERWITLDVNESEIVTKATTTDYDPLLASANDWLQVFDAATRRKLHNAGVFPSDEELMSRRSTTQTSATMPRSERWN